METIVRLLAALAAWIAGWIPKRPPAASPPAAPAVVRGAGDGTLHSRFGGRAWRYDDDGVHADGRLWRTAGEPVTCRAILALYGDIIHDAAQRFGVALALIVMTIATETAAARRAGFTGPATFRWESHVLNRDVTRPFRGSYSAGPMQVLATTARDLMRGDGTILGPEVSPFAVAPALALRPASAPALLGLYDPASNIALGTAFIRRQLDLTGGDPILVAAAYNSGGLYESRSNVWHLRSHGDHLDRAARWYGDACAVLQEARAPA